MQFVANGPDIPDALLQAHEEGRVVFFCGAGFPIRPGCRGSRGWWMTSTASSAPRRTAIEQDAYDRNQFDATLDLLERRLPGQRLAVRTALAKALQPKLRRKGATDTHAALLQLARSREGALRLVTTNFDRIFERVAKRNKQACRRLPSADAAHPEKQPLERAGVSARPAAGTHGRQCAEPAGAHQRRLWPGLPDRTLGGTLCQRVVPQLRGVLRGLQHQRPGAALHDGCAWPPTGCWAKSRPRPMLWAIANPGRSQQDHRVGSQGRYADPLRSARRHARPFGPAPHA